MTQTPTVGRIVHYTTSGDNPRLAAGFLQPAIITGLSECGGVYLHIFPSPHGQDYFPEGGIYRYAETPTPGCWNWPPRT